MASVTHFFWIAEIDDKNFDFIELLNVGISEG